MAWFVEKVAEPSLNFLYSLLVHGQLILKKYKKYLNVRSSNIQHQRTDHAFGWVSINPQRLMVVVDRICRKMLRVAGLSGTPVAFHCGTLRRVALLSEVVETVERWRHPLQQADDHET